MLFCFLCVGDKCFPGLLTNSHTCRLFLEFVFNHKCLYSNHQSYPPLSGPPSPGLCCLCPRGCLWDSSGLTLRAAGAMGELVVSNFPSVCKRDSVWPLCRKRIGWEIEVARVHNSISCFARCKNPVFLHDIAKSIGRFLPGCPVSPVDIWGPVGAQARCFQAREHFRSLLVSSLHIVPVAA